MSDTKNNESPNDYAFSTHLKIRFADCDMFGHVNNAKYFTYMEQARIEYLQERLGIDCRPANHPLEQSIILAETRCTYKMPAYLGDTLMISLQISEVKHSSFVMDYLITHAENQQTIALGQAVLVLYNYREQKSVPIPDDLRQKMKLK